VAGFTTVLNVGGEVKALLVQEARTTPTDHTECGHCSVLRDQIQEHSKDDEGRVEDYSEK
jgi:hypothetical protein